MGFTVRSLLARIAPMRPDLKDQGMVDYITQEVARRLMKDTFLGQTTQDVFYLPKGVDQVLLSASIPWWDTTNYKPTQTYVKSSHLGSSRMAVPSASLVQDSDPNQYQQKTPVDVFRVMRIRIARLPYSNINQGNFISYWPAAPGDTLAADPSLVSASAGDFYIAMTPGSATLTDGSTLSWNAGDVIQSDGSAWTVFHLELFNTIPQSNQGTINQYTTQAQSPAGAPNRWTQMPGQMGFDVLKAGTPNTISYTTLTGMNMYLYPQTDYDTAIEFVCSTIPIGEIGDLELNLPMEARDCIVAGALAEVLQLPGEGQNLALSQAKQMEFERLRSPLLAMGILGAGGSPTFVPPPFGSRGGRFWPYWFQTYIPGP